MADNFNISEWRFNRLLKEGFDEQAHNLVLDTTEQIKKEFNSLSEEGKEHYAKTLIDNMNQAFGHLLESNENIEEDSKEYSLEDIAKFFESSHPELSFNINQMADRIDVSGDQRDLMNFGDEHSRQSYGDYEVFHTDDDDRGEIVRIVRSDTIYKGGVNEENQNIFEEDDRCTRIAKRKYDVWPSAYASGAVVRCRKGEIWKNED